MNVSVTGNKSGAGARQVTEWEPFQGDWYGLCWGMDHGSLLQLKEFQVLDGHFRHERRAGWKWTTFEEEDGEERRCDHTVLQEIRQEAGSQQT